MPVKHYPAKTNDSVNKVLPLNINNLPLSGLNKIMKIYEYDFYQVTNYITRSLNN